MAPRSHCSVSRRFGASRLALVALVALALLSVGQEARTAPSRSPDHRVRLELFAMSQCPYTAQVVQALQQVAADLGPSLELTVDYVGEQSENGELSTMHGPSELVGDLVQICAARHAPGSYFRMIGCQSQNIREVDANWEQCARDTGVPVAAVRRCATGAEGKRLLAASFARAKARGVRGSPTIFIAGSQYQGMRSSTALLRALCGTATGPKPQACASLPPSAAVNVTILSDRRCPDCRPTRLESQARNAIANPVVTELDYGEPLGKRLYEAIKPVSLPVMVLDSTVDADPEARAKLAGSARQVGPLRVVPGGGQWNPECADPGGCAKPACRSTLVCRPETPGTLELFVMSQCPFAAKALQALPDALAELGGEVRLSVRYIGTGDRASGLKSMHGDAEVREDVRQLCAAKAFPKSYLRYLACRARDARSEQWEACTGPHTGVAAEPIASCVKSGEGARLLEQSFRLSEGLGVGASPSWIANGRHKFSAIDAAAIKAGFCRVNGAVKACAAPPP